METPDTSTYMIAGFAVSFFTLGIYVFSLYLRSRNLNRDVETLEALDKKKK
jgi:CcmD family protein